MMDTAAQDRRVTLVPRWCGVGGSHRVVGLRRRDRRRRGGINDLRLRRPVTPAGLDAGP